MTIDVIHQLSTGVLGIVQTLDFSHGLSWHVHFDWTVLAQQYNQDILADLQKAFNHFVKTGQAWAFLIGIVLGYLFKSLTSFG